MSISTKFTNAKPGAYFYESLAARNQEPKLLKFMCTRIGTLEKYGKVFENIAVVDFVEVSTGKLLVVDADDRYGYYPPLSGRNFLKIRRLRNKLSDDLAKYDFLLSQINAKIEEIVS